MPTFTCHLTIAQLPPGPDGKESSTSFTAEAAPRRQQSNMQQRRHLTTSSAAASPCRPLPVQRRLQAVSSRCRNQGSRM